MDILEQGLRDSLNAHETGEKMYLGGDGNLYTQSQIDEENMTLMSRQEIAESPEVKAMMPMVGSTGRPDPSYMIGRSKLPFEEQKKIFEAEAMQAVGFPMGLTTAALLTLPDLLSLTPLIAAGMITADEGKKLEGVLNMLKYVPSAQVGDFLKEQGKSFGFSDEQVEAFGQGYLGGELSSIIVNAVPGAKQLVKGAKWLKDYALEPGQAPAMAPNVPSAMNVDIEAGEPMLSTPAKRQDLKNLLDQGAPPEVIDNHPAVVEGIMEMTSIPKTNEMPDYGTPEFWGNRQYTLTDGTPVVGKEAAVDKLLDEARTLASREMGLETPVPTKFERKAIIILGPPAAGKSTLANPIAAKYGATIIDGDEAKKIIPGFKGGVGAGAVHEESSALIDAVKDVAIATGENVVFPKVGDRPKSIRRLITELKEAGYNVDLMEMQVTPDEAMRRMYGRFASRGRLIPPDMARSVGDGPSKTFDTLMEEGIADGYTRIDNNPESGAPKPVLRDDRGLLEGTGIEILPVPSGRGPRARGARGRKENAGVSGNDQSPSAEKISGLTDTMIREPQ
jgi:predicted kinase